MAGRPPWNLYEGGEGFIALSPLSTPSLLGMMGC